MPKILQKYTLVEKLVDKENLILTDFYKNEYQQCRVLEANKNSDIKTGDRVLVGNKISFDPSSLKPKSYFIYEEDIYGIMKDEVIIPRRNYVYIQAEKDKKKILKYGSLELIKDTTYNPLDDKNVVQDGVVLSTCSEAYDSYYGEKLNIEIESGDHVYCHHFLTHKHNEREFNGKMYYELHYENVYCKVKDGNIIMLNDWNFVTPVVADQEISDSGIVLDFKQKNQIRVGIINHTCKSLEKRGIKKGDKVFFKTYREYKIYVEGTMYYRILTDDILYKID